MREHFAALGPLEIKRMFGGAGVYAGGGPMFALLDDGEVWLKGDETNIPALQAAIRDYAATAPAGRWIVVWQYDNENLTEKRHITRAELDAVGAFLQQQPVVGFNSYGEQFNGMHINQTFTGVAIGQPRARRGL